VNSQHLGGSLWPRHSKMLPHAMCRSDDVLEDAASKVRSKIHQLKCAPDGQEILALWLVVVAAIF
jgi:hypothetical protein